MHGKYGYTENRMSNTCVRDLFKFAPTRQEQVQKIEYR